MRKKLIIIAATLLMLMIAPFGIQANTDSLSGLTLEKEFRAMIGKGIIKGYGVDDYRPKGEVTREQFAGFLARTLELEDAVPTFTDVNPSTALGPSIGAIQSTGIMLGTKDNRFLPTQNITREEMALTISRVIKYKELSVEPKVITFEDAEKFTLSGGLEAAILLSSVEIMKGGNSQLGKDVYIFNPKNISTRDQVAAVLYRYLEFEASSKPVEEPAPSPEPPVDPVPPKPEPKPEPVDPNAYQVAEIFDGKLVPLTKTYTDYKSAESVYKSNGKYKAIIKDGDIIKIKSGRAFGGKNPKNYTSIYTNTALTNEITYVQHGREMKYIGSGPDYAIVQAGGTVGYVRHSEIELVPNELVTGKEYYMVDNGLLRHYTYNNILKKSAGSYTNGPAPGFMEYGKEYYSFDGVHFYDSTTNNLAGTYYPYFQFLSVRTPTEYTGAELDKYIMEQLTYRETYFNVKDATKKSKLLNIGEKVKELEAKHNINAMFILSVVIHESEYGMSAKAQACNNIFGISAFDASTKLCERTFDSPAHSAEVFINEYMNKNYVNALGKYSNGAVPGNKTTGVNVKYASDPNWGSKVAGHMYSIDNALGGKEYGKYKRGITTAENDGLNVRDVPGGNILFTYKAKDLGVEKAFGYPVVIVDSMKHTDGAIWYKVLTDINPPARYGWIHSGYVKVLNN